MKRLAYFRILAISLLAALLLSAFSLICMARLAELGADRHRADFLLFLAVEAERAIGPRSLAEIKSPEGQLHMHYMLPGHRHGPPPGPPRDEPHPGPPNFPRPEGRLRPPFAPPAMGGAGHSTWLVDETEMILFSENDQPLPAEMHDLMKPVGVHEITSRQGPLRLTPGLFVVRLDHSPALFLVVRDDHNPFFGPLFWTQAGLTFSTVAMALFFALSITFFYLRRKSAEASAVLLRLERGDLRARFTIRRFDEFGGLILDFNRMAFEIERLVSHVRTTELTRKNLLQELGHDLRTPLTSLATSFETLKVHYTKMADEQREELFDMITAEIEYFKDLLEKLMTIAALDEPNYKQSASLLDLRELIAHEVKSRPSTSAGAIAWELSAPSPALVMGDIHLLQRLVKNGFDNAAKFARTRVRVELVVQSGRAILHLQDDGAGLSAAALESFGRRNEQRKRIAGGGPLGFSLGLGSVIMKTIAEVHGGSIEIANAEPGARLTIILPLAP